MLQPYKHQAEIIDRFKPETKMALFCEAGVGKTLIALNWLRHKWNLEGEALTTIILCPIIVLENWADEIALCTKIPEQLVGVAMGSTKKRLKTITDESKKIIIINYEATRNAEILQALTNRKAQVVICDESHKFKSYRMKTPMRKPTLTGAVLKLSGNARYRAIMSGTPTPSPEDIWSQYLFLDRGTVFGEKYYDFKNRYFVNLNKNWNDPKAYPKWHFIESKKSDYQHRLSRYAVSLKKEDCLELPDLVEQKIFVEPSPEQRKHYKEIKRDLITWIDGQHDNPLVVKNALTKVLRLSECLSGYLRLEDDSLKKLKNPTLDVLLEIIDQVAPAKVIVFCNFRENYKDIARALFKNHIGFVEIHGGVSTADKLAAVKEFNDMGSDARVCIANPQSGGVGINLKSASYTIYYSMGYSLVDFEQSKARNFRAGSIDLHEKITHYYLCHKGLLTENIVEAVIKKKSFADSLLNLKGLL